ncbi:MAG: DUF4331 family protein [Kofleriaceae bacterium]
MGLDPRGAVKGSPMNKITFIFLSLAAVACGDNLKAFNDASPNPKDGSGGNNFPAAPTLGTQIDRLGRPAINTVLNNLTTTDAAVAGAAKDAYNANSDPSTWPTYADEFAKNLAILDALDGTCGNQVFYNGVPGGGGADTATSYSVLATVLTNDQLFLDTSLVAVETAKYNQGYLAAELDGYTNHLIRNTVAGGRAPTHDVIDTSYTALAIGVAGFNTSDNFKPTLNDGAETPHADVSNTTFPFLGAPH